MWGVDCVCARAGATQLRGRVQRGNATWLIENTVAVADARGTLLQLFRTRVRPTAFDAEWSPADTMCNTVLVEHGPLTRETKG